MKQPPRGFGVTGWGAPQAPHAHLCPDGLFAPGVAFIWGQRRAQRSPRAGGCQAPAALLLHPNRASSSPFHIPPPWTEAPPCSSLHGPPAAPRGTHSAGQARNTPGLCSRARARRSHPPPGPSSPPPPPARSGEGAEGAQGLGPTSPHCCPPPPIPGAGPAHRLGEALGAGRVLHIHEGVGEEVLEGDALPGVPLQEALQEVPAVRGQLGPAGQLGRGVRRCVGG